MSQAEKYKVAIVEDEGLVAADLKCRLERGGCTVSCVAANGDQALKAIAETLPDVILMDIRLQGEMDGIQVAERVRKDFDVPVIYLTAFEDRETLERAGRTQAFGYLTKPVPPSNLRGSLETAISKHRHERYLREQLEWLTVSFAALPDAVMVTDGWGRVSYLNERAEELTNCGTDQALGRPYGELLRLRYELKGWPVEELPLVEDLVAAAMLEGVPISLPENVCLAGPDGLHAVEGTVSPRWHNGRPAGAAIVFRDIGPRRFAHSRRIEENKQQALARLATAISSRLDMEIGVVADESANLLQNLPAHSLLRARAENLEMAALDAFSVVSRLEAFVQPRGLQIRDVHINELLSSFLEPWKQTMPGLSLSPGDVLTPVQADDCQLRRALSLILKHAADAMKPDAPLAIETAIAELPDMGSWVHIRFAYAAFGEDARALEHAFEPSWTDPREGLPAAYSLLQGMGGFLTAAMEPGTVTWNVYLRPAVPQVDGGDCKPVVLLIESNYRIASVLERHLGRHGFDLVCVGDCAEAQVAIDLHDGSMAAVIANPSPGDSARAKLETQLASQRPDLVIRWLSGYRQEVVRSSPTGPAWHFLTKWDLLEWLRKTIAGDAAANGHDPRPAAIFARTDP